MGGSRLPHHQLCLYKNLPPTCAQRNFLGGSVSPLLPHRVDRHLPRCSTIAPLLIGVCGVGMSLLPPRPNFGQVFHPLIYGVQGWGGRLSMNRGARPVGVFILGGGGGGQHFVRGSPLLVRLCGGSELFFSRVPHIGYWGGGGIHSTILPTLGLLQAKNFHGFPPGSMSSGGVEDQRVDNLHPCYRSANQWNYYQLLPYA